MPTAVKICGLTRPDDVDAAVAAGADYVGAILATGSRRVVAPEALATLFVAAAGKVPRVAVTVAPDDDLLDRLAASRAVDLVQLHGHESPERIAEVRRRTGLGVIKALPVAVAADLADVAAHAAAADLLLFDAKPPPGAPAGGNGLAFDWRLVRDVDVGTTPWGLAGGLDPTNVEAAARLTGAGFVDVATGVETAPGLKDHDLVRAFVAAAKRPPHGGKE